MANLSGCLETKPFANLPRPNRARCERKASRQWAVFETENLAALWIDPGHDMPDGTVLAGSIHALKNQQQRGFIRRIVQVL